MLQASIARATTSRSDLKRFLASFFTPPCCGCRGECLAWSVTPRGTRCCIFYRIGVPVYPSHIAQSSPGYGAAGTMQVPTGVVVANRMPFISTLFILDRWLDLSEDQLIDTPQLEVILIPMLQCNLTEPMGSRATRGRGCWEIRCSEECRGFWRKCDWPSRDV